MIGTIARKEFLEMVRDGRVRATSAIVLAMLIAALLMGWREFRDISTEVEAARQTVRDQWLQQAPKNPHQAAHYGTYAFKPRIPLSLVDTGLNRFTGVALFLSPAIMTQLALTGIAGTDGDRYSQFVAATERFRRQWRAFLAPVYSRRFTSGDMDRIPRFSFDEGVSISLQ